MIYLIASIILAPEKTGVFNDIMEKEYLPIVEKHGANLIAALRTTIGNVDEVTDIWAFDSLEHFERIRRSQFKDPRYMEVRGKIRALMTAETLKLASPLSCSPLK
jgi:hypothetical protein